MKEILFLGLIFTLPAWFIIIRNFLWDLSFWQKKNYSLERFISNIVWDLDKDSLSYYLISFKFIIFAFLALGFQYALAGIIGIILLLITWTFEAFHRLGLLFITKEPKVTLLKPRNLISVLSFITFLVLIFLLVTIPFVQTVAPNDYTINFQVQLNFGIPSVYIYLIILYSLFLLIDLATSVLTTAIQLKINLLVRIRRYAKLKIYRNKLETLTDKNQIILLVGDNFLEISNVLKAGLPNTFILDVFDPNQINEFILDNNLKNKYLFVKVESQKLEDIFKIVKPNILVLNSFEQNLDKLLNLVPASTEIVVNSEIYRLEEITKDFKGEVSFFSGKHHSSLHNKLFTSIKYIESSNFELKATYSVNKNEFVVNLKTANREYLPSVAAAINIITNLGQEIVTFKNLLEKNFKETTKNIFLEGDNGTHILDLSNYELTYSRLIKNIVSASKFKENNKLIVISNGLGKANLPESFYDEVSKFVDVFITNDSALSRQLSKRSITNYLGNSFKTLAYYARKASNNGDIILVEGHFKEPLIEILKKN